MPLNIPRPCIGNKTIEKKNNLYIFNSKILFGYCEIKSCLVNLVINFEV